MNRLILTFIALFVSATMASAENWCENLVNQLNAIPSIDKTVTVERNPKTHQIESAVYIYTFKTDTQYANVWDKLHQHVSEAEYFSQRDKNKRKIILMRVNIDGQRWDCKLYDKKLYMTINGGVRKEESDLNEIVKQKVKSARTNDSKKVIKKDSNADTKIKVELNNKELQRAEQERKRRLDK